MAWPSWWAEATERSAANTRVVVLVSWLAATTREARSPRKPSPSKVTLMKLRRPVVGSASAASTRLRPASPSKVVSAAHCTCSNGRMKGRVKGGGDRLRSDRNLFRFEL